MSQTVTIGGDRLGSGNKQKVELHDYQMSSFNLEQDFKSSMMPGVLYPFLKLVGTNHGTFEIDLDTFVRTLPTQGPLFGSFKLQVDLFNVPFRLYQGILHNNPVDIGLKMNQVYLPKLYVSMRDGLYESRVEGSDDYNWQINDGALLKYLGLSGIGRKTDLTEGGTISRKIQAVPVLAYYDIFKNYYSNKQEENAYVITPGVVGENKIELDGVLYQIGQKGGMFIPYDGEWIQVEEGDNVNLTFVYKYGKKAEDVTNHIKQLILKNTKFYANNGETDYYYDLENLITQFSEYITYDFSWAKTPEAEVGTIALHFNIRYAEIEEIKANATAIYFTADISWNTYVSQITLTPFALKNIDKMRSALLSHNDLGEEFVIGLNNYWNGSSGVDNTGLPYSALFNKTDQGISWNAFESNGLVVKTYQSDLFNNWLDSEYIDGEEGISALTKISVVNSAFTVDDLNWAQKMYDVLNRVLVSGNTYQDWQEAMYGEGAVRICETPMYIGGMSAEVMFEEVISTAETKLDDNFQALGSLGGKGTQVGKKGGNNIHVKCDEPCYVMGIVSLTPRICYSQGNDWDLTELDTLNDLHVPGLDGIGFQNLMVEQFAWWNTAITSGTITNRDSAGKQTAWINYQTAVDKCYGDFARANGFAFMVLNRNYEIGDTHTSVKDITTYIDPTKYNYAFAYQDLAAQNFWVQVHSKVIARRKMGAQQIPNL